MAEKSDQPRKASHSLGASVPHDVFQRLRENFRRLPAHAAATFPIENVLDALVSNSLLDVDLLRLNRFDPHLGKWRRRHLDPDIARMFVDFLAENADERALPVFMQALKESGFAYTRELLGEDTTKECVDRPHEHGVECLGSLCRRKGPIDAIQELLVDVDLSTTDYAGRTLLHHACFGGSKEIVHLLLSRAHSVGDSKPQASPRAPLVARFLSRNRATRGALGEASRDALENQSVKASQSSETLLAPKTGGGARVPPKAKTLLEPEVSSNTPETLSTEALLTPKSDEDTRVPPHTKRLLESDAGPESPLAKILLAPDITGATPFFIACAKGHIEVLDILAEAGADTDPKTVDGLTPLLVACRNRHFGVVCWLLNSESAFDVNAADSKGNTAMHFVSRTGNSELVSLLVEHGGQTDITNTENETALHIACSEGFTKTVDCLLKHGANREIKERWGMTPLACAVLRGRTEAVDLLLKAGARLDETDTRGNTPLHIAAKSGSFGLVQRLLECGAQTDIRNSDGSTALHTASALGYLSIVELLLDHGAERNVRNKTGKTALLAAALNKQFDVARTLLCSGASADIADDDGNTALHVVTKSSHRAFVNLLLEYGANVNAKNIGGSTPLNIAITADSVQLVSDFMSRGAAVEDVRQDSTALHVACKADNAELATLFLQNGVSVDATDGDGNTALHVAGCKGQVGIAVLLLQHGADVNARNEKGNTPAHTAISRGHVDLAKILLQHGAHVNIRNNEGNSLLHIVSFANNASLTAALLQCNGDISAKNSDGRTALHIASAEGMLQTVQILVDSGAPLEEKDFLGDTPLLIASARGHRQIVLRLLLAGASVDAVNGEGNTALYVSSFKGFTDLVSLLTEKGAQINRQNSQGKTALHVACAKENLDIVNHLLNTGADTELRDNRGNTPFLTVCSEGQWQFAKVLLDFGADIDAADSQGNTPVHLASQEGRADLVEKLIRYGGQTKMRNKAGQTALHVACAEGHVKVVRVLLSLGADPLIVDDKGNTSLHEACIHGGMRLLELFLESRLSNVCNCLGLMNEDGDTPLHIASSRGGVNVVNKLIKLGAPPNMSNKAGKTPMDLALENNHMDVVQLLEEATGSDTAGGQSETKLSAEKQTDTLLAVDCSSVNMASQFVFSTSCSYIKKFFSNGGKLQGDSDIMLVVPEAAVCQAETVCIGGAVSVDLPTAHKKLKLGNGERIVSPVVEYSTDRPGYVFNKNVQIYLPHFLPEDFSADDVNIYMFHREEDGSVHVEALIHTENQGIETDGGRATYCFSGADGILVFTPHFTGVVCSYCGKLPPQLHLRLYGTHIERDTRDVDLTLLIGDRRIKIREFREFMLPVGVGDPALSAVNLGPVDDIVETAVGAWLKFPYEIWTHRDNTDSNPFPSKQSRDLQEITRCCEDTFLETIHWSLKHRADRSSATLWFTGTVDVGYIKSDDADYSFFQRPAKQTLFVDGLKLKNEERSMTTQTDDDVGTDTYVKRLLTKDATTTELAAANRQMTQGDVGVQQSRNPSGASAHGGSSPPVLGGAYSTLSAAKRMEEFSLKEGNLPSIREPRLVSSNQISMREPHLVSSNQTRWKLEPASSGFGSAKAESRSTVPKQYSTNAESYGVRHTQSDPSTTSRSDKVSKILKWVTKWRKKKTKEKTSEQHDVTKTGKLCHFEPEQQCVMEATRLRQTELEQHCAMSTRKLYCTVPNQQSISDAGNAQGRTDSDQQFIMGAGQLRQKESGQYRFMGEPQLRHPDERFGTGAEKTHQSDMKQHHTVDAEKMGKSCTEGARLAEISRVDDDVPDPSMTEERPQHIQVLSSENMDRSSQALYPVEKYHPERDLGGRYPPERYPPDRCSPSQFPPTAQYAMYRRESRVVHHHHHHNVYNLNIGKVKGDAVNFGPTTTKQIASAEEQGHAGRVTSEEEFPGIGWEENESMAESPLPVNYGPNEEAEGGITDAYPRLSGADEMEPTDETFQIEIQESAHENEDLDLE